MTDTEEVPARPDDPETREGPRRLWLWIAGAGLLVLVVGFLAGAMIAPPKQGRIDSLERQLASARKQHATDETKMADQEDQRRALLARITATRAPLTAASRKAALAAALAKRKGLIPKTAKTPATPQIAAARKAAIIAALKAKAAAKSGAVRPSKPAHRAKAKHRSRRHHKARPRGSSSPARVVG